MSKNLTYFFRLIVSVFLLLSVQIVVCQHAVLEGRIRSMGSRFPESVSIVVLPLNIGAVSTAAGDYKIEKIPFGRYTVQATARGFAAATITVNINRERVRLNIEMKESADSLNEVVVTGTLRPVIRSSSPVPVEVYTPQFLRKNPTPNIFEALQQVNGVRPQINCNVCNTGDIHINGLEGPYTMVTIDGMPVVSSLASVYGLFGIPNQLIEKIEIVKGPASSLYGSEAVGGLINIITRDPAKAARFSVDVMGTSWGEFVNDIGIKFKVSPKTTALLGINYFKYQNPVDRNNDSFTDLTLQNRISVFNKWSWNRKENRVASLALRYIYEDRWGGDMRWEKKFRGGDSIYGESIYTNRLEIIGRYQLPVKEKLNFSYSYTDHRQDGYYGTVLYIGSQQIGSGQLVWEKNLSGSQQLLAGIAARYNRYDDNTTATIDTLRGTNRPDRYLMPGIFVQHEMQWSDKSTMLLGFRYDHHPVHGSIFTPRLAYKWNPGKYSIFRINAGTGFRVVSLFTEEHAALTGARAVVVKEKLKPERSYNVNLNYTTRFALSNSFLSLEVSTWYTHFTNQIIADYLTNNRQIIYSNLQGFACSMGASINVEYNSGSFRSMAGVTLQEVYQKKKLPDGQMMRMNALFAERWSGTWLISYNFPLPRISFDYTGNIYGPMLLPLLNEMDPRLPISPVWSVQNLQCTKKIGASVEVYAGVKNLLNWTPVRNNPFLIARSSDPFNKKVQYDQQGNPVANAENPYGLVFDPYYVYAPNQGRRIFIGIRYNLHP